MAFSDRLYDWISYQVHFGGQQDDHWKLLDLKASGDCDSIAGCLLDAYKLLVNDPNAAVKWIRANVDADPTKIERASGGVDQLYSEVSNGTRQYLMLDFHPNNTIPSANLFEGVFKANGFYYAMGGFSEASEGQPRNAAKLIANSPVEMLRKLTAPLGPTGWGAKQTWFTVLPSFTDPNAVYTRMSNQPVP